MRRRPRPEQSAISGASSVSPKDPGDPKARAIKLLARREHSARELKRKLEARGIEAEQAASVVAELAQEGWQSDGRYAELLVRSRVSQGYGPLRITAELKIAGVPTDQIHAALEEAGTDWRARAAEVRAKHFRQLPKTTAERARQYRYLLSRGFDTGHVQAVLKGEDFDD